MDEASGHDRRAYLCGDVMQLHGERGGGGVRVRFRGAPLLLEPRTQRRQTQRLLRHARLEDVALATDLLRHTHKYTILSNSRCLFVIHDYTTQQIITKFRLNVDNNPQ